jgi:hypothetical protein
MNKRILLASLLGIVTLCGCSGRSNYILTADDHICRVGERVRLNAKFEFRGVGIVLNKAMEERRLDFYLDGKCIGGDRTDEEGYATIKHRFDEEGLFTYTVTYGNDAEDEGRVFVWAKDTPILVVDIDGTLAETRKRDFIFSKTQDAPAFPHAAATLNKLATRFRIVYLTARPRELLDDSRAWLARNNMPIGPVFTWDIDRDPLSSSKYKRQQLDDLQDDFPNVTVGIGNSKGDYKAYRRRRVFAIMFEPTESPRTLDRGVQVDDWTAIDKLFDKHPDLFDSREVRKLRLAPPQ